MNEWRLSEISYKLVKARRYEVAVLPIGATEPHGLHLPYCTDNFQVEGIADIACQKAHRLDAKVILLPTIPYGSDSNQLPFPLAIDVRPSTLNTIVTDIVRSLEYHGIYKLIVLNGHGGNDFKPLLRELYGQTKVFITLVDWWKMGEDLHGEVFENPGEHADEMETSCCLVLVPHLVNLEEADDGAIQKSRFEALNQGWASITRPWEKLTKNSGYGDPRKATAEKGRRYIEIVSDRLGQFIKQLSDSKMDEKFPY